MSLSAWEQKLQIFTTVATNLGALLPISYTLRCCLPFETLCGVFTMMVSIMYHLCECLGILVLEMNDGQWHRLDNVGAILSWGSLCLHMCQLYHRRNLLDTFRWCFLFFTLWCQERGPWEIQFTLIPILCMFALFLIRLMFFSRDNMAWCHYQLIWGAIFLVPTCICFARGLDDDHDWIRLWHGLWHFFASLCMYFFISSVPVDHVCQYTRAPKKPTYTVVH
eukprot:gnl/Trimastix_PCT/1596.p1 GENE.gnl/Trimastix_PCT/1596~~gnl/Trimastix_PCT/1596.p1  ORF type:complete len:222 (+),score=2.62 gnl/Trimastix_PCT/1596:58-723(+)